MSRTLIGSFYNLHILSILSPQSDILDITVDLKGLVWANYAVWDVNAELDDGNGDW